MTVLFCLISASSLCAQQAPQREDAVRFDTIYSLVGQRRFAEARDEWNRLAPRLQELLAASGPAPTGDETRLRVAEALFVQGLLTARLGEKEEALRLLRQADGYGFPPVDSPLMVLAGECLYELEEHTLATQAYREVLKHAPRSTEARLRLGVVLYSSGQLGPAEKELEEVLRQAPRLPQANYFLGAVLFEQKRTDQAQTRLEKELALDPRCHACMAKLAHLAYLKGDDRQCESWLAKAAAMDPGYFETNLVTGMLELRKGRYERAIAHLTRVVEESPGYARAQYQLALAYQRSGNAGKAREHREIYSRLIQEQKAKSIGVRGAE